MPSLNAVDSTDQLKIRLIIYKTNSYTLLVIRKDCGSFTCCFYMQSHSHFYGSVFLTFEEYLYIHQ